MEENIALKTYNWYIYLFVHIKNNRKSNDNCLPLSVWNHWHPQPDQSVEQVDFKTAFWPVTKINAILEFTWQGAEVSNVEQGVRRW